MTPEEVLSLFPGRAPRVTLQRQRREERWRVQSYQGLFHKREERKETHVPSQYKVANLLQPVQPPQLQPLFPEVRHGVLGHDGAGAQAQSLAGGGRMGWELRSELPSYSLHSSVDGGCPSQGYHTSEPVCKMGTLHEGSCTPTDMTFDNSQGSGTWGELPGTMAPNI